MKLDPVPETPSQNSAGSASDADGSAGLANVLLRVAPLMMSSTVVIGRAAPTGWLVLTAGEPGMRVALPNSRVMVHQPSGGYQGQATDIMIHAQETQKLKTRLNEIYVKHTGQPLEKVEAALERDNFMSPEEAKDWGLIDEIVENRGKMDDPDAPKDGDKKGK